MTRTPPTTALPSLPAAKASANELRQALAAEGVKIGHSQALEKVAHRHGFRDWNAMHAAIRDLPARGWNAGQRVTGRYLSQPFTATILSAEELDAGWFRLVFDLDEAVDAVRFEGMSNLRKRIRADVGPEGRSRERTSDGSPHVALDM